MLSYENITFTDQCTNQKFSYFFFVQVFQTYVKQDNVIFEHIHKVGTLN